jgi:hypothetical protein
LFRLGFLLYLVGLHALVYAIMYWGTSTHSTQVRSAATAGIAGGGVTS